MLLAHDVAGQGPAVLVLHSGVTDRRMWHRLMPALSHAFRVVAVDLRGFGDSPLPGEEFADADDLATLLDRLEIPAASVVGCSFGGRVALELAGRYPDRVASLVLLCPAYAAAETTAALAAFAAEEDRLLEAGDLEGAVDLNVRTWLGPEASPETAAEVARMQRRAFEVQLAAEEASPPPVRRQVEVGLDRIVVPVTVVTGGLDLDHFRAVGPLLAGRLPDAEHLVLPWAGHLPALERPEAVQTLLLDVLRHDPSVHAP